MKKFKKIERKGLPGGPNEQFTYITGMFSTEGYKSDSPDVNNPFNIIDSGNITMEGVEFPVMGTDNLGNSQMMMPGMNYQFPGDMVFEIPMAQKGGGVNEEGVKQYEFLKEYMNSPMYAQRLKMEFPDYTDEEIAEEVKTRLENVMQTRVGFLPKSSKYSENIGDVQGFVDPENFPNMMMLRPEYSALTPDNPPYSYNTTPIHEWQHVADEVGNRMSQSTKDLISSLTKDNILDMPKEDYYYTQPTEIVARIQELRYLLDDQGIYDAKKGKFTQEDLDKAKKNDRIKYNARFQDLMDNLNSDEALIELMNSIAAVDTMDQDNTMMAQDGIEIPKRIGVRKNPDGSESTHIMATETFDGKNWFSFPTLFQDPDGTWVDMSEQAKKDWKPVYEEAKKRGEVIDFGTDKEAAIKFGEGSWKSKMKKGGSVSWQWKGKTYSGTLIPSMETATNRYARTENGKIKTLPKRQDGGEKSFFENVKDNLLYNVNPLYQVDDALQILGVPANLIREAIEGIGNKGDGSFDFKNIIPDIKGTTILDDTPDQKPVSETLGVDNFLGALATDMLLDPSTYVGAGIIKNLLKKGSKETIKKAAPKIIKETKNVINISDTPKRLPRPSKENYTFYRFAEDDSGILEPLDLLNPTRRGIDGSPIGPKNLTFFAPTPYAYVGYGGKNAKLFGANIVPKKPYMPYKGQVWDPETVQKLMDEGYDAIIPMYGRGDDIRDAYEIIPLDKSIIKNLEIIRALGGESLPMNQAGGLKTILKTIAKKADEIIPSVKNYFNKGDNFEFKTLPGIESKQLLKVQDGQFSAIEYQHLIPTAEEISDIAKRTRKRLLTDKIIKNNMEATGKSREEVISSIDNFIKEFENSTLQFNTLDRTTGGLYTKGKITIDPTNPYLTKDNVLGVLEHEIEHMFSDAARQGSDLYRHPVFKLVDRTGRPDEALVKNIAQPFEQQVRLRKALSWLEKNAGLKPGGNVTDEQVEKLTNAITNWSKESGKDFAGKGGFADVQHLFSNLDARQFLSEGQYLMPGAKQTADITKPNVRKAIKDILNKTYVALPFLGGAALEEYQKKGEVKSYDPYMDIDPESQKRRDELLSAIDKVVETQGGDPNLKALLIMTAAMENSLGADSTAYGRDYTRGPMSMDDIAYITNFEIGKGANDYSKVQKKYFDWFESLGFDLENMDYHQRNNVLANVAGARMQYGLVNDPLPKADDPEAMYKYYMDFYNRTNADHKDRFMKNYNAFIKGKEKGGEVVYKIYKKFMQGGFTGNEKKQAEKIFDKLNRVHYKDAKKLGMTPTNYMMTFVIPNS